MSPNSVIRTTAFLQDAAGHLVPDDPFYSSSSSFGEPLRDQWGLQAANLYGAWDSTRGFGVRVGVIDTGVDFAHQDLGVRFVANPDDPHNGLDDDQNGHIDDSYHAWDFHNDVPGGLPACYNPTFGQYEFGYPCDDGTHGSHVAGLAVAASNAYGVIGVAPEANVMSAKVFSVAGFGEVPHIANGVAYMRLEGADVHNNSWSMTPDSVQAVQLQTQLFLAHLYGGVVVASAGNNSTQISSAQLPGSRDYAITVAALRPDGAGTADFSNYGPQVDVAAPGGGNVATCSCTAPPPDGQTYQDACNSTYNVLSVKSTTRFDLDFPLVIFGMPLGIPDYTGCPRNIDRTVQDTWMVLGGTSMAAPHVAGAAALLLSKKPNLQPYGVEWSIRQSAVDLAPAGVDQWSGFGKLDVNWLMNGYVVAPPTADAYVKAADPNGNFGSSANLDVREPDPHAKEVFLKFDVAAFGKHQGALLRLRAIGTDPFGSKLYKLSNGNLWSESTITWNNRPTEWGTFICDVRPSPYVQDIDAGQWAEIDITSYLTPKVINNFVIRKPSGAGAVQFWSKESATSPEVMVYGCGCGGCTGATVVQAGMGQLSTLVIVAFVVAVNAVQSRRRSCGGYRR